MGYIRLETENADYRLVFGRHTQVTAASPIPDDCTGVFVEYGEGSTKGLYEVLEFSGKIGEAQKQMNSYPRTMALAKKLGLVDQYKAVRDLVKERSLPYGSFEPICKVDDLNQLMEIAQEYEPFHRTGLFKRVIRRIAGAYLLQHEGEISVNSLAFKWYAKSINRHSFMHRTRDHIMAQRAEAFARLQITQGIKRPNLVLITGMTHVIGELGSSLAKTEGERVAIIMDHPLTARLYDMSLFYKGHYVQYDRKRGKWSRHEFVDRAIKEARFSRG